MNEKIVRMLFPSAKCEHHVSRGGSKISTYSIVIDGKKIGPTAFDEDSAWEYALKYLKELWKLV